MNSLGPDVLLMSNRKVKQQQKEASEMKLLAVSVRWLKAIKYCRFDLYGVCRCQNERKGLFCVFAERIFAFVFNSRLLCSIVIPVDRSEMVCSPSSRNRSQPPFVFSDTLEKTHKHVIISEI